MTRNEGQYVFLEDLTSDSPSLDTDKEQSVYPLPASNTLSSDVGFQMRSKRILCQFQAQFDKLDENLLENNLNNCDNELYDDYVYYHRKTNKFFDEWTGLANTIGDDKSDEAIKHSGQSANDNFVFVRLPFDNSNSKNGLSPSSSISTSASKYSSNRQPKYTDYLKPGSGEPLKVDAHNESKYRDAIKVAKTGFNIEIDDEDETLKDTVLSSPTITRKVYEKFINIPNQVLQSISGK